MNKKGFSKVVKGALLGLADKCEKALMSPRFFSTLLLLCMVTFAFAQSTTAGDYAAGTAALGTVSTEIAKYVPVAVKLCYAIAGVVAVVGAISVYIKMNNEEQDVKNILVLQNRQETKRKKMKLNLLLHNTLCRYFNFPIFENVVLKNI